MDRKDDRNSRHRAYHRRSNEERIADLQAEIERLRQQEEGSEGIAQRVSAERRRLGLSAAHYGRLVGVSMLTIYNWEHGRSTPRSKTLRKWRSVEGIDRDEAYRRLGLTAEERGDALAGQESGQSPLAEGRVHGTRRDAPVGPEPGKPGGERSEPGKLEQVVRRVREILELEPPPR